MGLYLDNYDVGLAISGKALEGLIQTFVLEEIAGFGLPFQILFADSAIEIGMPSVELLPRGRLSPLGQILPDREISLVHLRDVPPNSLAIDFPFKNMNLALEETYIQCADGVLSLVLPLSYISNISGESRLGFELQQAKIWMVFTRNSPGALFHQGMENQLNGLLTNGDDGGADNSGLLEVLTPIIEQLNDVLPGEPQCPITLNEVDDSSADVHPLLSVPSDMLCTDFLFKDADDKYERVLFIFSRLSPDIAESPVSDSDIDVSWRQTGNKAVAVISNRFLVEDIFPPSLAAVILNTQSTNLKKITDFKNEQIRLENEANNDDIALTEFSYEELLAAHFDTSKAIIEPIPYRFIGLPLQQDPTVNQLNEDLPDGFDIDESGYQICNGFIESIEMTLVSTLHPEQQQIVNALRVQLGVSADISTDDIIPDYSFDGWVSLFISFKAVQGSLVPDVWVDTVQGLQINIGTILNLSPELVTPFILNPLSIAFADIGEIDAPLPIPLLFNSVVWDDLILKGEFDKRALINSGVTEPRQHDLIGNAYAGIDNCWLRLDADSEQLGRINDSEDNRWRRAHSETLTTDAVCRFSVAEFTVVNDALAVDLGIYPLWQARNKGVADILSADLDYTALTINWPDIMPGEAQLIAVRSAQGRYALLVITSAISQLQCFYRRYPQLMHSNELLSAGQTNYRLMPGARTETINLPVIMPGGQWLGNRDISILSGRQTLQTVVTVDAVFYRWIQPVEMEWRVEDTEGQITVLTEGVETIVLISGASVKCKWVSFKGGDIRESLNGSFGSRCYFETTMGSSGEFTVHVSAREPCTTNSWQDSHSVTYNGRRTFLSGFDKVLDSLNESLRNLGELPGAGPIPPPIKLEGWGMMVSQDQLSDDETYNGVPVPKSALQKSLKEIVAVYSLGDSARDIVVDYHRVFREAVDKLPDHFLIEEGQADKLDVIKLKNRMALFIGVVVVSIFLVWLGSKL
tara:strand:+ start:4371 stop:7298 length:2928 start_codon:yes stop_codon:yes gene_type:complete